MGEIGEVPATVGETPKAPVPSIVGKEKASPVEEPIRTETVGEIADAMSRMPFFYHEVYETRQLPSLRVDHTRKESKILDEETGLIVTGEYTPGDNRRVFLTLSTTNFPESANVEQEVNKMGEALKKIYGGSEKLEELIERQRRMALHGTRQNITFTFQAFRGQVPQGGSGVNGELATNEWQILDSGGEFIKGIVERAVNKNSEQIEANKLEIEEVVRNSAAETVSNDLEKVKEYAYHGSPRWNLPSIAKTGLLPSGERSVKEPGTIFFAGWGDGAYNLGDAGVLFRVDVHDFPELMAKGNYEKYGGFSADSASIRRPVPPDKLDFSLDGGKTWMPIVPKGLPVQEMAKAA